MRTISRYISTIAVMLSALALSVPLQAQTTASDPDLVHAFKTPSHAAKPQVWWHWMDGNVNKDGIRKDLEWMKREGFGGFHQFDAGGVNMPQAIPDKKPYFSESWKEHFRYALNLADSLGLDVTIASAPGWSSTGGTWVTPEDAVKKLEWRSIDIVSSGKVSTKMPDLYRTVGPFQDYYVGNDRIDVKPYGKDLYVIAVRKSKGDLSMEEMGAKSVLSAKDTMITVTLAKPQTIKAFTLQSYAMGERPRSGEPVCKNVLECSKDGKVWTLVQKVMPSTVPYMTEDIRPVKAKYFRVRGSRLKTLELYTVPHINHLEEEAGYSIVRDYASFHTPFDKDAASTADVIDLTGAMSPDGTLSCTLPAGRWRIYRFGWSITGKVNHPASPEATGLEVDKLDKDAWMNYFRTYVSMYKEAAGGMLGEKGIRYLLTDSYEAGSFTWTQKMAEQFKERRGYDLLPWMPVLAGEIIGSSELSEKFLWDWRRTLGELFCENYDRINDIVKEYKMAGRYCETHEGGRAYTGDGMDPRITSTVPMAAFWMQDTPTGSPVPGAIADIKEAASVAHIYGQHLVAGESFSVNGDEGRAYTYCPENMKYIADVALSSGLNRFVIHESSAQPNDKYLPGLELYRYGQWIHRNETWGEYAYVLLDYLARSSAMLQQGNAVVDILLYYGEDGNATAQYGGSEFSQLPQIPAGYDYDFANPTVILSGVEPQAVNDGCAGEAASLDVVSPDGKPIRGTGVSELVSKSGARYKILYFSKNCEIMSVEILERFKAFADAGVVICGPEPSKCAGMLGDSKRFAELTKSIWHSGRANVVSTLDAAFAQAGLTPDFTATADTTGAKPVQKGFADFKYVHRTAKDGSQIYWVRNFTGAETSAALSFRDGARYAYLFNAENGKVVSLPCTVSGSRFIVTLPFKSTDAAFIVFSEKKLDTDEMMTAEVMSVTELPDSKVIASVAGPWTAHFEQKNGGTADETFETLYSWTEKSNPVVKYFAGTAVYKTTLDASSLEIAAGKICLDLGAVKNLAEVYVNGHSAGVLWKAPFRTDDIRSLLVAGENQIEVLVTNVWRNRMIGDVQPGETQPVTQIRRFYTAKDSLLPAGLLGPVRLVQY